MEKKLSLYIDYVPISKRNELGVAAVIPLSEMQKKIDELQKKVMTFDLN
jgi:hypothetical protein